MRKDQSKCGVTITMFLYELNVSVHWLKFRELCCTVVAVCIMHMCTYGFKIYFHFTWNSTLLIKVWLGVIFKSLSCNQQIWFVCFGVAQLCWHLLQAPSIVLVVQWFYGGCGAPHMDRQTWPPSRVNLNPRASFHSMIFSSQSSTQWDFFGFTLTLQGCLTRQHLEQQHHGYWGVTKSHQTNLWQLILLQNQFKKEKKKKKLLIEMLKI